MPPSITSEKITLTYPIYGAAFIDGNHLLVGGGGGEGRSGVGNKITLLDVSGLPTVKQPTAQVSIKVLSELELSKQEDAVMSLAVVPAPLSPPVEKGLASSQKSQEMSAEVNWLALAGINSSESSQKSGKNNHFRVFGVSLGAISSPISISLLSENEVFSSTTEVECYQRLLRTKGSLAAIASGSGLAPTSGSEIVVVDITDLGPKRRIRLPGKDEAGDLDLTEGGILAYCTAKDIFITSVHEGSGDARKLTWQSTPPKKGNLRSIRFCGNRKHIIAVLNYPQRTGSELFIVDTTGNGKLLGRKKLHKNIKAVTGMDTLSLGPHQEVIAVTGADQSVEILVIENNKITTVRTFRDVHPFQITKVAFSPAPGPSSIPSEGPEAIRLATTSMGNTVVVFTLPLISKGDGYCISHGGSVTKQTVFSVLLSLIGVVIFSVALQLMFEARAGLPLPIEGNVILSKFNEVLGTKTDPQFMVLKEIENGDEVNEDVPHTVVPGEVVPETPVQDID